MNLISIFNQEIKRQQKNNIYNMKRIIITEEEKRSIRKMYLIEGGDDPIVPSPQEKLKIPTLSFDQKNILKTNLWDKIEKNEDLKHSLGLDSSHHEENFLNKISHMTHAHYDPNTQHLGISFPNLGKQHNMTFDLGFGLNSHKETHGDDHGHSQLSSLTPHSVFDFGVKIPLNKLFN